jgi:hypothetical protein
MTVSDEVELIIETRTPEDVSMVMTFFGETPTSTGTTHHIKLPRRELSRIRTRLRRNMPAGVLVVVIPPLTEDGSYEEITCKASHGTRDEAAMRALSQSDLLKVRRSTVR